MLSSNHLHLPKYSTVSRHADTSISIVSYPLHCITNAFIHLQTNLGCIMTQICLQNHLELSPPLQWIGSDPEEALLQLRMVSLSAVLCV